MRLKNRGFEFVSYAFKGKAILCEILFGASFKERPYIRLVPVKKFFFVLMKNKMFRAWLR